MAKKTATKVLSQQEYRNREITEKVTATAQVLGMALAKFVCEYLDSTEQTGVEDRLVTRKEAMKFLGVSTNTFSKLLEENDFGTVLVGNAKRYSLGKLQRFADKRE